MTPETPMPDYGEPWILTSDFAFDVTINGKLEASFDKLELANRAISCVNACQGMADPAAEIKAMREAVNALRRIMQTTCRELFEIKALSMANAALAKLRPFLASQKAQAGLDGGPGRA